MAKKIKINTVNGPSDGSALENYYFEESGDGYNFYAPNGGTPLNGSQLITAANPTFHFSIPNYSNPFYITVTSFPVEVINGTWSDNPQALKDVAGSGTFQAQAGGTGPVEEEAAAASA